VIIVVILLVEEGETNSKKDRKGRKEYGRTTKERKDIMIADTIEEAEE